MIAQDQESSPVDRFGPREWGPIALWLIASLLGLMAPFLLGDFSVSLLNDIGISALVALGLVLLTGVGGATSFGQAAFVGIAAYATAWLGRCEGLSPWLGLLFSLTVTGVAACLIGLATLRLGGHFLPLSTIAWGLSIPLVFGNMDSLGRYSGMANIPALGIGPVAVDTPRRMYYLIAAFLISSLWFSRNLLRSRPGRTFRALRSGSQLLASVGASSFAARLQLFVIAALFSGVAGWLYTYTNRFVSPSPFDLRASIEYLLMAMAGGVGYLSGAVLGSAVVLVAGNLLQDLLPLLSNRANQLDIVAFSLLFIALLHFARGGAMALVWRQWRRVKSGGARPVYPAAKPSLPRRERLQIGELLLDVDQISKRFGGLLAVDKVSFRVYSGEIVGLIGPNGAGKSTMFNLLTGTLGKSGGRVTFLGQDITHCSQRKIATLGIARTFQHVKLRPAMTLLDNVALGAHSRSKGGALAAGLSLNRQTEKLIAQDAAWQLKRVGLGGREFQLAGSLSLGEQRILEIARALAMDPVLLILDEPAAGLRRLEKKELATFLKRLRDEDGVTILIVEHDMDFVMNLVDRLVVMNFGAKLIEGEPGLIRASQEVQAAYLGFDVPTARGSA
ncbi:MAG: branched-chain amino acid ABC transporter ATP-binding protein/permease [Acidobacteriota bacterium]|nr:branched-chain amino acid ABC transporter ATP-binding protein/permease [Acidobacteriota bacterium]